MKKLIHLIAAARPNFMKIAPLYHELKTRTWCEVKVIHTGQHYDLNMSDAIFEDLNLPEPDIHLGAGSGTHAQQTGRVMIAYEKILMEQEPFLVVVVGDVNSTMAATLASVKLGITVAHLEAGLRSCDRSMPEEINRIVTDCLADILWTPSADADVNLRKEGIAEDKIERVGNIMIDSLVMLRGRIESVQTYRDFGLRRSGYGLVTLHRPSNVDSAHVLEEICEMLEEVSGELPLIFPVHPRTSKNLSKFGLIDRLNRNGGIHLSVPLSYIPFMNLVFNSKAVITDSGGIQEETTYLGIPCFTLRPNTERPVTIFQGTNQLCTPSDIPPRLMAALQTNSKSTQIPEFWDGHTAERVADAIECRIAQSNNEIANNQQPTTNNQ